MAEIPELSVSIDILEGDADKHADIKDVCKNLLPGWIHLADSEIEITIISGGISNALYKVAPTSGNLEPVALRIYGIGTEKFVDRTKEVQNMQLLHKNGFGAAILGLFENGRIESYLSMRCLSPEEMANETIAQNIASNLARFHSVDSRHCPHTAATPFFRIREWLSIARALDFSDNPEKLAAFKTFNFDQLMSEVSAVEGAARPLQSPLVFAHNDLLSGNIMVQTQETTTPGVESITEMTFIDFEYADWAPRGFDLGNHFCEYAGFECDYARYPNTETASKFLRSYLAAAEGVKPSEIDEAMVAVAVADANVHALAAHQYWGTWAIMQAKWSTIEFDYMEYAALRWGEYYKRKDEFLQQAKETAGLVKRALAARAAAAAAAPQPVAAKKVVEENVPASSKGCCTLQ